MRWDCVVLTGFKLVTVSLTDPLKCWGLIWPLYACLLCLCISCKEESRGEFLFRVWVVESVGEKDLPLVWELGGYLGFGVALKTTNDIAKPFSCPGSQPCTLWERQDYSTGLHLGPREQ